MRTERIPHSVTQKIIATYNETATSNTNHTIRSKDMKLRKILLRKYWRSYLVTISDNKRPDVLIPLVLELSLRLCNLFSLFHLHKVNILTPVPLFIFRKNKKWLPEEDSERSCSQKALYSLDIRA